MNTAIWFAATKPKVQPEPRETRRPVRNGYRRTLIVAVAYAALVILLLAGGGLYVRSLISASFQLVADVGNARALVYDTLRYREALGPLVAEEVRVLLTRLATEDVERAVEIIESGVEPLRDLIGAMHSKLLLTELRERHRLS